MTLYTDVRTTNISEILIVYLVFCNSVTCSKIRYPLVSLHWDMFVFKWTFIEDLSVLRIPLGVGEKITRKQHLPSTLYTVVANVLLKIKLYIHVQMFYLKLVFIPRSKISYHKNVC